MRWQADASSKAQFEELTECASDLMANGEYEVYSDTKRVFERDAGACIFYLQRSRFGWDTKVGHVHTSKCVLRGAWYALLVYVFDPLLFVCIFVALHAHQQLV